MTAPNDDSRQKFQPAEDLTRETFSRLHPAVSRMLRVPGPQFEFGQRALYDPPRFQETWAQVAQSIIELKHLNAHRQSASLGSDDGSIVLNAVERAVLLVSSSLYGMGGGLTINCVIGTETILSPFGEMEGLKERFARFAAALLEKEQLPSDKYWETLAAPQNRRAWYKRAAALYEYRNKFVHEANVDGKGRKGKPDASELAESALKMFLGCLDRIVRWAIETTQNSRRCDKQAFHKFYEEIVNGLPPEEASS